MLPVSGALQLNTSGARCERPMTSKGRIVQIAETAGFGRGQEQVPQAGVASPRFEFLADGKLGRRTEPLGFLIETTFVRVDMRRHELAEAIAQLRAPRALTQIHRDLSSVRRRRALWRATSFGCCVASWGSVYGGEPLRTLRMILPVAAFGRSSSTMNCLGHL